MGVLSSRRLGIPGTPACGESKSPCCSNYMYSVYTYVLLAIYEDRHL